MRQRDPARQGTAFTLIELLVVISIIAILVGLLLPVLSTARAVAISAKCLANQHGLVVAMVNYETDNQGAVPGVQTQMPLCNGYNGPGELGAPAPADNAVLGWREGQQIYGTFTTGQGDSNPTAAMIIPGYAIGTDAPFTANSTASPYSEANPREYCAPIGLGYLGMYVSPTGNMDATSGQIFYCPGTVASFGPFAANSFGASYPGGPATLYYECSYFGERKGPYGLGLYSTFLADWDKQPGGSSANAGTAASPSPVKNPEVFSTYIYRSGHYYDSITSTGHVVTGGVQDAWHSEDSFHTDGYPKSDTTYLNGECFMVCDSEIASAWVYYWDYEPTTQAGVTDWLGNICHLGKSVNRAFHDGSARTFTIPAGQLPPYAVANTEYSWDIRFDICNAPPMMEVTGPPTTLGYQCWPYYWAILDGGGVYAENP